jgi:uncharacterized membrane protein YtjA (UPF0391 family)
MLHAVITFLVLAIIAGALGFTVSIEIARMLFFIFLVLFVVSLIATIFRGKRPPVE